MKLTWKALPLTLLYASLVCGAALAQVQPPSGPVHSRFGLPLFGPEAPPVNPANRQAQSPNSPALSLTFGIFTYPGSVASLATGANKAGHIVGGYGPDFALNYPTDHGFLLKGTTFTAIDYPAAAYTEPTAINDGGVIVGFQGASFYDEHGFKLVGKTYTSIDYPGSTWTSATGINKHGDIVGAWGTGSYPHGFLLSKGVFTSIDVPGAVYTGVYGINSAGEIVGVYSDSSGNTHGFELSKGTFTTLDYPGYSQNYLTDINDSGLILGGYGEWTTINGVAYEWEHCYVYQSGTFTTFDAPFGPPAATQVWHLNNYGVITGFYADNSSTTYGFEATVAP